MSTIPAFMLNPIRTAADAYAFLYALNAEGRLFHMDDDPATVIDSRGAYLFVGEEIDILRERMRDLRCLPDADAWDIFAAVDDGRAYDADDARQRDSWLGVSP